MRAPLLGRAGVWMLCYGATAATTAAAAVSQDLDREAVFELVRRAVEEPLPEGGLHAAPAPEPRALLAWSPSADAVLRLHVDNHQVRFETADEARREVGVWELGYDSLPSRVQVREFGYGDVLAAARTWSGSQELLSVGWLRWETGLDGAPVLRARRLVTVDALTEAAAGAEAPEEPLVVEGLELLEWEADTQTAVLLLQRGGRGAAFELHVRFEELDRALESGAATAARPAWRSPRSVEARRVASGQDVRAARLGGAAVALLRQPALASPGDPFGRRAPLAVVRRTADGAWARLPLVEAGPLVERSYTAWTDADGALCVTTPASTELGGVVLVSHRLTATGDGRYVWRDLGPTEVASGALDPASRLAVGDPGGARPFAVGIEADGRPLRTSSLR